MTLNIFSDTDFCLACEKPLKQSNQSYCDDECRAKDGASKRYATGAQVSPSILASLPALLASHITLPTRPRDHTGGGGGGSTSSTSRSEESSPLQSPSPFVHPEHAIDEHGSPKEDAFMLPGPAYPTTNTIFGMGANGEQNTYTGTTPIKITSTGGGMSFKTQGFLPPHSSLKNEFGTPIGAQSSQQQQQQTDSTLHYGRRPGHTNSVTSPLALFPVNVGNAARRRESHGAHSSAAVARSSPHGLSPLTKPIRLVSEPMIDTGRSGGQHVERRPTPPIAGYSPLQEPIGSNTNSNQGRRQFAYGMHSPLIVAANATAAVDFSHAAGTPSKVGAVTKPAVNSSGDASRTVSSSLKQEIPVPRLSGRAPPVTTATKADESLVARRRSFPVQLIGSLRSQLMTPVAKKSSTVSGTTTKTKRGTMMASDSSASHSESDDEAGSSALISSTELERPAPPSRNSSSSGSSFGRPDERGRGRSRAKSGQGFREETSDSSAAGPLDGDSVVAEARRHLGIGSTDRNFAGHHRSSSHRTSRGGSSEGEREGRRPSRVRRRSRDRSRGRSSAQASDAGSQVARIPSVPLPNMPSHGGGRFHASNAGDLSTIIGSLQQSQEDGSPVACGYRSGETDQGRGAAAVESKRFSSDRVGSLV